MAGPPDYIVEHASSKHFEHRRLPLPHSTHQLLSSAAVLPCSVFLAELLLV